MSVEMMTSASPTTMLAARDVLMLSTAVMRRTEVELSESATESDKRRRRWRPPSLDANDVAEYDDDDDEEEDDNEVDATIFEMEEKRVEATLEDTSTVDKKVVTASRPAEHNDRAESDSSSGLLRRP